MMKRAVIIYFSGIIILVGQSLQVDQKVYDIISDISADQLEKYVGMLYDEYQIRRKSLELGIPVLSTIELAESFVKTLEWLQKNETSKEPLGSYKDIT